MQNFGKNLNFGNFQTNCRVNAKICVFVSTYPFMISVLFNTFFFTFGKVTDSQKFKEQDKSSDIEQQPPFGDRKLNNIYLKREREVYKTIGKSYNLDKV